MLVLASASPRRRDLLDSLSVGTYAQHPAQIDETPLKNEQPRPYVERLAREKASTVAALYPDHFILGADTVIAMGRRLFHKAQSEEDARQQINLFSGRRHRVYTGLCLITPEAKIRTRVAETILAFKRLDQTEIEAFIKSREWEGVCGYRIQGIAGSFLRFMRGTPSNVMGLPLLETANLLKGHGYPLWQNMKKMP